MTFLDFIFLSHVCNLKLHRRTKLKMVPYIRVDGQDGFGPLLIFFGELEDQVRVVLGRVPMHVDGVAGTDDRRPRKTSDRTRTDEAGKGPTTETQN